MSIRKNVGPKERAVRIVGGIAMMLCGLVGLKATPLGWVVAAAGAGTLVTGLIRFCPACSLVGRKHTDHC